MFRSSRTLKPNPSLPSKHTRLFANSYLALLQLEYITVNTVFMQHTAHSHPPLNSPLEKAEMASLMLPAGSDGGTGTDGRPDFPAALGAASSASALTGAVNKLRPATCPNRSSLHKKTKKNKVLKKKSSSILRVNDTSTQYHSGTLDSAVSIEYRPEWLDPAPANALDRRAPTTCPTARSLLLHRGDTHERCYRAQAVEQKTD